MYNGISVTESLRNLLVDEQEHVAVAEQNLDFMRVKVSDYKIQLDAYNSSLAVHETTLKQAETELNFINQKLADKQQMVKSMKSSTQVLVKKVTGLRKKVSDDEKSLEGILKTQLGAFMKLEHVSDEKVQLEQKQEEQINLVDETAVEDGAGIFEKWQRRRQVDKLVNSIKSKRSKQEEINAEFDRLKATRKKLDNEVQSNMLLIATTEKLILENGAALKNHNAKVERLSLELQDAKKRYTIEKNKVKSLQKKIAATRSDIGSCSKAVKQLEQTLAKRQSNVIDWRRRREEVSDEVTLAIAEDI